MNLQQSFQQVNVQQLSDSALAEYQQMLELMLVLAEAAEGKK